MNKKLEKYFLKNGPLSIGFIVDEMCLSQLGYELSKSIHEFYKQEFMANLFIFTPDLVRANFDYKFAVMNSLDIAKYFGSIVAFSPDGWKYAVKCPSPMKYYYAYSKVDDKLCNSINPRIMFTRSKDYVNKHSLELPMIDMNLIVKEVLDDQSRYSQETN